MNIWDQEGRNKILDKDLRLVSSFFHLVDKVVKSLDLQFSFFIGLKRRSCVNGIADDVL